MVSLTQIQSVIFCPLYPVLLYLFLAVTTLHVESSLLVSLRIESLTLLWTLFATCIHFITNKDEHKGPMYFTLILGLLFITTPLLSSLATQDYLNVLLDEEYQTLVKMILFIPCLVLVLKKKEWREVTLDFLVLAYGIFAIYFLYRYLILHEVRDYDLRPQLKIRHGDANFLCTFFSMMIPLSLLQSWKSQGLKKILFIGTALLLSVCVVLTESRMGLIATSVGMLYFLSRPVYRYSKRIIPVIILIFVVALGFSGERILKRFSDIQDKSNSDRFLSWENGFQVFTDQPFFGAGIHKARDSFYHNTGFPHFQSEAKTLEVHNTFLKTLAELGLIGFSVFCFVFFWPWIKTIRLKSEERYFYLSSLIILSLSILTIGLTYKDLFILHLFLLGAIASYNYPAMDEV